MRQQFLSSGFLEAASRYGENLKVGQILHGKISVGKKVEFHGHSCPGLATGYRVAEIALDYLREAGPRTRSSRSWKVTPAASTPYDRNRVHGKGNLIFRDMGNRFIPLAAATPKRPSGY